MRLNLVIDIQLYGTYPASAAHNSNAKVASLGWAGLGWTAFDFRLGQALAEVEPAFLAHAHLWEWPFVKHLDTAVSCAKNSWTNQDAVWDTESGGSKEACVEVHIGTN